MHHYKNAFTFFGLLFIGMGFGGCITSKTLKTAKQDYRNESITVINSPYADSGNVLVINFTVKSAGHKKSPCHISIPVDSLIAAFQQSKEFDYYPDSAVRSIYKINRIYRVFDAPKSLGLGIGIELGRDALVKGFYIPANAAAVKGRILNYSNKKDFHYGQPGDEDHPSSIPRHPVFIFYPAPGDLYKYNSFFKTDYIALSIAPTGKRKYTRYALLPLTVAGDIVTLPFQAIGAGYLLLLSKTMGY